LSNFKPNKKIKSRYSITNIQSTNYQTILSGGTNNYPSATLTSAGTYTEGYIFVPYIMCDTTLISQEIAREIIRQNRKDKLKKLGW
jgi:hypothetical protein